MINEKIIERVKKLLSLANSNNANESESAMLKAQELMAKYKLSIKDVDVKEKNNEVVDVVSDFEYTIRSQWKGTVALVIAENFGCDVYAHVVYKNGRKNKLKVCFIGEEENVEIVKIVYEYALKVCDERIKKIQKDYKKKGLSTTGIPQSYGIGFATGLKAKYSEQLKTNQDWGLVVVKSKDVIEYTKNKNLSKSNARTRYRENEHYSSGYTDGKNFTTNNVLA